MFADASSWMTLRVEKGLHSGSSGAPGCKYRE